MRLPTVRIISDDAPNGFVVINESDFDASLHVLFLDAEEKAAADQAAAEARAEADKAAAEKDAADRAEAERKAAADAANKPADAPPPAPTVADPTDDELRAALKERGIKFAHNTGRDKLLALLSA